MAITPSGVAPFSFTIKQGSDFAISMTWLDDNGNPMNLTGYQMNLPIRAFVSSPIALLTLSSNQSSGSYIALGGTAGTIDCIFANADTSGFAPTGLPTPNSSLNALPVSLLGVQNLQYIDPTGKIGYLFEGQVYLDPKV